MPAAPTPARTIATFRRRLLAAQECALETLLHLAQDLTNPTQARLASTALLRTRLPDPADEPDEQVVAADAVEVPAPSASLAAPTTNTPSTPPPRQTRPNTHPPQAADDSDSANTTSLTALAAAIDRITRAPSGIAAALLAASGTTNGYSVAPLRLTG